jgi:small subunit ribosomal protein S6
MFILESGRYGRDPGGVAGQIPQMVEESGGKILVSRLWEDRRLAYPIHGHRKGTYWLTYFELEGSRLGEIRRKTELSETILRALFLKVDPRIVDALVKHALAGPTLPAPPEEAKTPVAATAGVPSAVEHTE